jgi:hypothetical protein
LLKMWALQKAMHAESQLLFDIAVLSGYITSWNKQAETGRFERRTFVKS